MLILFSPHRPKKFTQSNVNTFFHRIGHFFCATATKKITQWILNTFFHRTWQKFLRHRRKKFTPPILNTFFHRTWQKFLRHRRKKFTQSNVNTFFHRIGHFFCATATKKFTPPILNTFFHRTWQKFLRHRRKKITPSNVNTFFHRHLKKNLRRFNVQIMNWRQKKMTNFDKRAMKSAYFFFPQKLILSLLTDLGHLGGPRLMMLDAGLKNNFFCEKTSVLFFFFSKDVSFDYICYSNWRFSKKEQWKVHIFFFRPWALENNFELADRLGKLTWTSGDDVGRWIEK